MKTNYILMPVRGCHALTRDAVESCLSQDIGNVKVLVADDASADGVVPYLRSLHPKVQTVSFTHPIGVTKAWNIMLEYVFGLGAEYALVLNNDVRIRNDAFRLLAEDGGSFVTCVGTSSGAIFPGGAPSKNKRPHPDFSCYLIRRECWETIGRFDERMKIYCSDGDYHLRMHQAGIEAYCLDLPFYHYASGTLKTVDDEDRIRILKIAESDRKAFNSKHGVEMGSPEYYRLFESANAGL